MTFAQSRGVGVRVIRDGRLGYAYAADPTRRRGARGRPARARERGARRARRVQRAAAPAAARADAGLFRDDASATSPPTARSRWRWTWSGARSRSIRARTKSTRRRSATRSRASRSPRPRACAAEYARTDAWGVVGDARGRGRRDPDRVLVHDRPRARRPGLGGDRRRGGATRGPHARRHEAADREGPGRARPVRRHRRSSACSPARSRPKPS